MEVIHLKAGEKVAKRKDKVSAWYIVQEGTVTLCHEFEETTLGPNSIIGILNRIGLSAITKLAVMLHLLCFSV